MGSLTDLLTSLGHWNWILLAVILFVFETIIPGVHFLWFGLAAMIVGIVLFAIASLSPEFAQAITWPWQLIAFALISFVTVFFMRRYTDATSAVSDEPELNVRGAQYVGRVVTVATPIKNGRGKVKIGDTLWQAQGEDATVGTRVKVIAAKGTVLQVERE